MQDGLIPERWMTVKGQRIHIPGYGLIPDDKDHHLESSIITIGEPLPKTVAAGHPGLLKVTITELIRTDRLF